MGKKVFFNLFSKKLLICCTFPLQSNCSTSLRGAVLTAALILTGLVFNGVGSGFLGLPTAFTLNGFLEGVCTNLIFSFIKLTSCVSNTATSAGCTCFEILVLAFVDLDLRFLSFLASPSITSNRCDLSIELLGRDFLIEYFFVFTSSVSLRSTQASRLNCFLRLIGLWDNFMLPVRISSDSSRNFSQETFLLSNGQFSFSSSSSL